METRKAPVFVVGAPRSGTTFLTRLMNIFLDVHVARDAGTFLRFKSIIPDVHNISEPSILKNVVETLFQDHFFKKRILQRGLTLTPQDVLENFSGQSYADLIHFIMFEMARQQGKSRWGNKRPSYALHITELAELFEDARFIHIVRDGRDVAYSMRRATQAAFERNWYFAIKDWEHHVRTARNQGNQLPRGRYMEVHYEKLMQNPIQTLQKIVDFMGDPEDNRHRLHQFQTDIQKMIKPDNFGKWQRQVPQAAIRIMERAAGPTLEAFGYTLMFPEEAGKSIAFPRKVAFAVDNMGRKLFSATTRKALQYRMQWLLTRLRLAR